MFAVADPGGGRKLYERAGDDISGKPSDRMDGASVIVSRVARSEESDVLLICADKKRIVKVQSSRREERGR